MGSDIASRIRARFSRRRHSSFVSAASSHPSDGGGNTSSLPSQLTPESSFTSQVWTAIQTKDARHSVASHDRAAIDGDGDGPDQHGRLLASKGSTCSAEQNVTEPGQKALTGVGDGSGEASAASAASAVAAPQKCPDRENEDQLQRVVDRQSPLERVGPHKSGQDPPCQSPIQSPSGELQSRSPTQHHDGHDQPQSLHPATELQARSSQSTPSPTSVRAPSPQKHGPLHVNTQFHQQVYATSETKDYKKVQHSSSTAAGAESISTLTSTSPPRVEPSNNTRLVEDPEPPPPFQSQHGRVPDALSSTSSPVVGSNTKTSPLAASSIPEPSSAVSASLNQAQLSRRQSLFASRQTGLIKSLLQSNSPYGTGYLEHRPSIDVNMVTRKVWVKRQQSSPTTITVNEEDLVDDVRDMIIRKYANSLGRTFDSPDLVIKIHPRDNEKDRALGPEEVMARTLDTYYPGGQTISEALTIDIPRRTPKASPRIPLPPGTTYYITEDGRPSEAGEGYFPTIVPVPSPHLAQSVPLQVNGSVGHSISVLGTGYIPPIPSPGGTKSRTHQRPRLSRTHTQSPTILATHNATAPAANTNSHGTQNFVPRLPHSRTHSSSSDHPAVLPTVKTPMAKSPGPEPAPARVATPPPRTASPRSSSARPRRTKKSSEYPTPANILVGSVPPISVLIVEDNPINLKLLEAFVKRLKVRWETAMNGRDAVKKWRTGGFHLVLMDIQLPVMNGLDATREIRRLERVNSIGVFTSAPGSEAEAERNEIKDQDRLENLSNFKSPVIIVALTASSLQSDRHEALAAGCNDFLTKVRISPTNRRCAGNIRTL